jgi:metallo-beta-lactamase family protein
MESTYGDREHPEPAGLPHERFADVIRRTVHRGGAVLVPAFAVDRTEVVLRVLTQLRHDGRIPDVPIYVNSPMATAALQVYRRATSELRPDLDLDDFVKLPGLVEVRSAEESMALTRGRHRDPHIIISSSGMASGGRVLHHLERMLPDKRNAVVLTGYQAVGTRGRALAEGATQLKMHGEYVPVRAEIVVDDEFSVHADASDLLDWVRSLAPPPVTVFVTHGEESASESLARRVRAEFGCPVVVPSYGEHVVLSRDVSSAVAPKPAVGAAVATPSAPAPGRGSASGAPPTGPAPTVTLTVDGIPVTGAQVSSDLTVRRVEGDDIVLEGTITIRVKRG